MAAADEIPESRKTKLRVAAYIRVSTDRKDQENSYELQEQYFMQLLSSHAEWQNAGIYADYGISGTGISKRSGFRSLLLHCQEGKSTGLSANLFPVLQGIQKIS